ncbi:DUF992 domain-containing protein [Plastoroseomonas arctica]|uniref:DUF992 domain-containing protein n=1 Tax=Plastoroseomonas arctica TaxID=1509237 RepID=A0AAF1JYB7_9PROT|nr:DUF992 domain-containing protein [Plastoroseomonas arctica]MBR0656824.1 DUF992 domain-containing protein [Plastoroseomonas arctica]
MSSRHKFALGAALAAGLSLFTGAAAQAQSESPTVRVGSLRCDVAAGTSFVFGSTRTIACVFSPTSGRSERYTGDISRYGVDVGFVGSAVILWGVLAPSSDVRPGLLAGTYLGAAAGATAGVGVGANVLLGGGNRSIALQPISIEGNTGLNLALGVGELTLVAAN